MDRLRVLDVKLCCKNMCGQGIGKSRQRGWLRCVGRFTCWHLCWHLLATNTLVVFRGKRGRWRRMSALVISYLECCFGRACASSHLGKCGVQSVTYVLSAASARPSSETPSFLSAGFLSPKTDAIKGPTPISIGSRERSYEREPES